MTALAILLFAIGAWAIYCVFRPHTAWRLTEGWKYRDPENVQPSDLYLGFQSIGAAIGAVAAIGLGIALLVIPTGEERAEERVREAGEARAACEPVLGRFRETVEFEDREVANWAAVEALASELGVTAEIRANSIGSTLSYDTVSVRDADDEFLFMMSASSSGRC